MKLLGLVAMIAAVGLCSCAGQRSPAASRGSASAGGCNIDAVKVCQAIRNQPVVNANTGITEPPSEREENSNRTTEETAWYNVPSGHTLEVQCYINTEHSTVVYANYLKGPPLNESDLEFLRNNGLCKN